MEGLLVRPRTFEKSRTLYEVCTVNYGMNYRISTELQTFMIDQRVLVLI